MSDTREASPTPKTADASIPGGDEAALQREVESLQSKLKEAEAKYVYLYAEFENFKKRNLKERSDVLKFGWEGVAKDLLGVLDNLERALAYAPADKAAGTAEPALRQGLEMILGQFRSTMERQGVKTIEALEQPFDPNFHEAVAQSPSPRSSGTVIHEEQRGYTLHGRLLRPSRVVVSSGPQA